MTVLLDCPTRRASPRRLASPDARLASRSDAERMVREAVETGRLGRARAERLGRAAGTRACASALVEGAAEGRRRGARRRRERVAQRLHPAHEPLPRPLRLLHLREAARLARGAHLHARGGGGASCAGGVRTGCIEALFCLGDKPELAYRSHRDLLAARGKRTTAEYLEEACQVAFEGGMLPHTNAGILSRDEMARLGAGTRRWASCSRRRARGCAARAWRTSTRPTRSRPCGCACTRRPASSGSRSRAGILLGIGETAEERVDTLLAIRDLSDRYGHIQEVIVQPFHPKPATRMRWASPLSIDEVAAWVALARLVLGPDANVQAPPNLSPDALELLLARRRERLGRRFAGDGRLHQPRGALADAAPSCAGAPRRRGSASSSACPSTRGTSPTRRSSSPRSGRRRCAAVGAGRLRSPASGPGGRVMLERLLADVDPAVARILDGALDGRELSVDDAERLLRAEGPDLPRAAARRGPRARRRQGRRRLVRRQPEHQLHERLLRRLQLLRLRAPRDEEDAYDHAHRGDLREGEGRASRAARPSSASRAGSIPSKDHTHYLEILIVAMKREFPELHLHAFSPEEIHHAHRKRACARGPAALAGRRPASARSRAPPRRSSTTRCAGSSRREAHDGRAGSRS